MSDVGNVHAEARVVALVPMKEHSERISEKNYRICAGRPLYHHILLTLMNANTISEIFIDTDSSVIATDAARHFPEVTVIERPVSLRGDFVPMNEVLLHDITAVDSDYYLQTHSTNPLLKATTIDRAVTRLLQQAKLHDSLFSVTALHTRLWDADGTALNHDPLQLIRTQDLPPVYEENSCLYIFTRRSLETNGRRIGRKPLMFEIPRDEAWDIDDPFDFEIAEWLLLRQDTTDG